MNVKIHDIINEHTTRVELNKAMQTIFIHFDATKMSSEEALMLSVKYDCDLSYYEEDNTHLLMIDTQL